MLIFDESRSIKKVDKRSIRMENEININPNLSITIFLQFKKKTKTNCLSGFFIQLKST